MRTKATRITVMMYEYEGDCKGDNDDGNVHDDDVHDGDVHDECA